MKSRLQSLTLATMLALGLASTAHAIPNFTGDFAPAEWSATSGSIGDGGTTFLFSGGPPETTLTFLGGSAGNTGVSCGLAAGDCRLTLSVSVVEEGFISFDWLHTSQDLDGFELFGYALGSSSVLLAGESLDGSANVAVAAGQNFAFFYDCTDCFGPTGDTRITNFDFTAGSIGNDTRIPEPGSLALLGLALAGLGVSRRKAR